MTSFAGAEMRGTEGELRNVLEIFLILIRSSTVEVIHKRLCPCEHHFNITVVLAGTI